MNKLGLVWMISSLLLLTGCAGMQNNSAQTSTRNSFLTADAQSALDQAKQDINDAIQHQALWTTAQIQLNAAEASAASGDNAAVIEHARQASKLARLGIAQQSLRSTEPFK